MEKKLFKQVKRVHIGKLLFDNDFLDVEYEIDYTGDNTSDVARISIYNLTKSTRNKIKKGDPVIIECGYRDYSGVVFRGTVDIMNIEQDNNDLAIRIIATPNNAVYVNTVLNKQYTTGTTPRDIITDISNNTTFKIEVEGLPLNNPYKVGKCFSSTLDKVIEILKRDTKAKVDFRDNKIIFSDPKSKNEKVKVLGPGSGLVELNRKAPSKTVPEEYYILQILPVFDITINTRFKIESKYIENKNLFKVKEMTLSATTPEDFKMIITAEVVS